MSPMFMGSLLCNETRLDDSFSSFDIVTGMNRFLMLPSIPRTLTSYFLCYKLVTSTDRFHSRSCSRSSPLEFECPSKAETLDQTLAEGNHVVRKSFSVISGPLTRLFLLLSIWIFHHFFLWFCSSWSSFPPEFAVLLTMFVICSFPSLSQSPSSTFT